MAAAPPYVAADGARRPRCSTSSATPVAFCSFSRQPREGVSGGSSAGRRHARPSRSVTACIFSRAQRPPVHLLWRNVYRGASPLFDRIIPFWLLSFRSALRTPFWMSLSSDTTISKYFLPLHRRPFTLLTVSFEARKFLIPRHSRFLLLLPVLMLPGPAHLGDTLGLWGQRVGDPGSSHVLAHTGTPALLVRPTEVSSPFSVSAAAPHGHVRPPPPTPTHAPSETPTKAVPLSSFHRRGN